MTHAPDTLRAVMTLANPRPSRPERAAQQALLQQPDVDWDAVLRVAEDNGVAAAVSQVLLDAARDGTPLSPAVLTDAEARRARAIFRELAQRRALRAALAAIAAAGEEPPVLLKGAALRETLYPAPWLRPMDDIDLLVPADALPRIAAALAPLGYLPRAPKRSRSVTERTWHAITLVGPPAEPDGPPLRFDVHAALARPGRFAIEHRGLFQRSRPLTVPAAPPDSAFAGERPVAARTLSDADALLGLALHLAEMAGRGAAKRLVDMALLVRHGDIVWTQVIRRARRWHAVGSLRAALWLVERATGVAPPPWVWHRLHDHGARAHMMRALVRPPKGAPFAHVPRSRAMGMAIVYWFPDGHLWRPRFGARYVALRLRDWLSSCAAPQPGQGETS